VTLSLLYPAATGRPLGDVAAISMTSQSVSIQLRHQVVETAGRMKHSERKNGLNLIKNPTFRYPGIRHCFMGVIEPGRFESTYAFFLKGQLKPEVQDSLSL
jgi:hypothetical protein